MIKAGRGHLVNVSSFLGTIGVAHLCEHFAHRLSLDADFGLASGLLLIQERINWPSRFSRGRDSKHAGPISRAQRLLGLFPFPENRPEQPNILVSTVFPGHIRTPLFARLGHFSAANAFFYPLLEPHQVAKAIVDRIEAEHGGELHLPILGNLSWIWRALPSWARHAVKWVSADALTDQVVADLKKPRQFSEADLLMQDFHKNDR